MIDAIIVIVSRKCVICADFFISSLFYSDIPHAAITIVTYGLLRHPACHLVREALYNQNFKVIIADESHYLKNRKSATSKYLVPLIKRAERKILLTGTPALARPEEVRLSV